MKEFFQNLLDELIDSPLETIVQLSLAVFSSATAALVIVAIIRLIKEL